MSSTAGKVLVAMSGGVDSSVAAALLVRDGWEAVGACFRLPRFGPASGAGRASDDGIKQAESVARKLDIPFCVLDYREEFQRTVLAYFRQEYARGRTPNPCVRCNDWLKFGRLMRFASGRGAQHIATGHYARSAPNPRTGRWELRSGRPGDDQSYFLFLLSQDQLSRALFPLGDLGKDQVRAKAGELGLPVHDRRDSQDLCFLAGGGYRELLRQQCPGLFEPGEIVHVSGDVLGRHEGIAGYTVGQRRGLRVAGPEPLYVVALDAERNRVIVGERQHVRRAKLTAAEVNWVALAPPQGALRAVVRIRYRHPGAAARVEPLDGGRVSVAFDEPQDAPTPGQAAVFYDGDRVLGGGFIETTG